MPFAVAPTNAYRGALPTRVLGLTPSFAFVSNLVCPLAPLDRIPAVDGDTVPKKLDRSDGT